MTTGGDRQSDPFLLEALRRGEESAYDALFRRHYGAVYGVIYGLTGSKEAADDVAQDTFLALYRDPPGPGEGRTLISWLCRVALNKSHNTLRGEQRSTVREQRAARLDGQGLMADGPEAHLLRVEEQSRVRDALAQLPERQNRMLLLRHAGLSYAEIADLIGVAPGSVGTLLARAERAFAEAYRQAEDNALARAQALRLQTEKAK